MKKVEVMPSGCWHWTGSRNRDGYGKIFIGSHADNSRQWLTANRMMWIMVNGPIADDMEACHSCDNPPCVNPDHIFAAPHLVNMRDSIEKSRNYSTRGLRLRKVEGQRHRNAKLTNDQALQIFQDQRSSRLIANEYNISPKTVWKIRAGKSRIHSITESVKKSLERQQ